MFVGLGQDWCNYIKSYFEVMMILKFSIIKLILSGNTVIILL
jgi:hypothetical protein